MSRNNDFLAIQPRKQPSFSQHAGPSTRTRYLRTRSLLSLPSHTGYSSQADLDNLLDPLDDITLDGDLDQDSASSATLPSRRASLLLSTNQLLNDANCALSKFELPAQLSEPRQSCFLYSVHEPGEMTAQRVRRLRARTAAIITSLPATFEEVIDGHEPCRAAEAPLVAQGPKLRRVSGVRDLRRAFHDSDHELLHSTSISSFEVSKASYELGILTSPISPLSQMSSHSSSRTLVDPWNIQPQCSGDLKTLRGSTSSSTSIASRFAIRIHSTLPKLRPSHIRPPSGTSQSAFSKKSIVHNSLTPRPQRYASLQLNTLPSRLPGERVWSCAKISQSTIKRAVRRGHTPRRVFSNPIAVLSS